MIHLTRAVIFVLVVQFPFASARAQDAKWTPLFNGQNLDGFYTFVADTGKNKDPEKYFNVEDGMIHVMDLPATEEKKPFGYIATEKPYDNFHLRFQYKWGEKRYVPRAKSKRDSGVLYHVNGDDKVWPKSIECQIQEGDTGDLWIVSSIASLKTTVKSLDDKEKTFLPAGGVPFTTDKGRIIKSQTVDSLTDWNTVEVIAKDNSAVHIVNGKVVNRMTDMTTPDTKQPLTSGRIAFQAEGAEVFYRNIEIRPLRADETLPEPSPVPAATLPATSP